MSNTVTGWFACAAVALVAMPAGPARAPLIAPTLLRTYGLRSAIIFAVMILALGSGAMLLREVFR